MAQPTEPVATGGDREVVAIAVDRADLEAVVGGAVRADHLDGDDALALVVEQLALIDVGVEERPALLHADAGVVMLGAEQVAGDIVGGHGTSPGGLARPYGARSSVSIGVGSQLV